VHACIGAEYSYICSTIYLLFNTQITAKACFKYLVIAIAYNPLELWDKKSDCGLSRSLPILEHGGGKEFFCLVLILNIAFVLCGAAGTVGQVRRDVVSPALYCARLANSNGSLLIFRYNLKYKILRTVIEFPSKYLLKCTTSSVLNSCYQKSKNFLFLHI
jgi:hypothetical protein